MEMRLSGQCPRCTSPLVRRTRRQDKQPFLSCSGFPVCKFAEDWDPQVTALGREIQTLRAEVEVLRQMCQQKPKVDCDPQIKAALAYVHPDRWPNAAELAHGAFVRLNTIRATLKKDI